MNGRAKHSTIITAQASAKGVTRRRLGSVAGGTLLPVLAACATGQSSGPAPSQVATPTGPVTLDVAWPSTSTDQGKVEAGQGRQLFEQRHPGVTLNLISEGNAPAKVLAQAAAGTPPHVLHVGVGQPTAYVSQNLLLALDGYIQKDPENKKSNFASSMWDAFTIKGKQQGLPREGGPRVLYYNKSLFQAGGVAPPNERWMLAIEYKDAAVKLTKPGEPMVFGTDVGAWRDWVFSNGGDLFDAAQTKFTLDQPAAVEALQLVQDFRFKFKCMTTAEDNTAQAVIQRFMAGGLALYPGLRSAVYTSGFAQLPTAGIAPYPKGRAGRKFDNQGNGVSVAQPNKVPDLSYLAAAWLVGAEFQKLYYKAGVGGVVARLSVLQSDEYLGNAVPKEWNEFFAKGIGDLTVPPKLSNWPDISNTLDKELTGFLSGQETAAAVTTRIAPQINSMLQQAVKG